MSRTIFRLIVFAVLQMLSGQNSSASLVLPDAEFSFSAPVLHAKEATDAIREALVPLGFKMAREPRVRDDGFFRAEFERAPSTNVSLKGRVSCVHVAIYTSLSREPKKAEAIELEATEIYDQLLASLRIARPKVLLFKSSGGKGVCEEAL